MKLALAILAAVLLLAGCGHAAKDPFAGTWQVASDGVTLVITPLTGNSFRFTQVTGTHPDWTLGLSRHGDRLSGQARLPGGSLWKVALTYLPATGRLRYTDNQAVDVQLSKVSDNAIAPTPSPS